MTRRYDVALCGYYGFGNVGDEMILHAIVELAQESGLKKDRILALSASPRQTEEELSIAAVNRWRPKSVLCALRESRTLLLGGGGLLQDATSLRSPLYYWGVVMESRIAGCRPWAFGQSVGPFHKKISERIARDALRRCSPRIVRDTPSQRLLSKWGLSADLAPDPAFVLDAGPLIESGDVVILNIRPWGNLSIEIAREAAAYAQKHGYALRCLALSPDDEALSKGLQSSGLLAKAEIVRLTSWKTAASLFAGVVLAVGMRFHFLVLTLLLGAKAVAVPYDPKVESLAESWSIPVWNGERALEEVAENARRPSAKEIADAKHRVRASFQSALKEALGGR